LAAEPEDDFLYLANWGHGNLSACRMKPNRPTALMRHRPL
jgi:hypothetical protein